MIEPHRLIVRRLEIRDVRAVLEIIGECRSEYALRHPSWTLLAGCDDDLFETYRNRRSAYFVATLDDEIVGGAGIARLKDSDGSVCELQRMCLGAAHRTRGVGHVLLERCLTAAREFRYCRCYAETLAAMLTATTFFERRGFKHLDAPLGGTGPSNGDRWLLLEMHAADVIA
jgi:putative acetyltransferase